MVIEEYLFLNITQRTIKSPHLAGTHPNSLFMLLYLACSCNGILLHISYELLPHIIIAPHLRQYSVMSFSCTLDLPQLLIESLYHSKSFL